MCRGYFSYKSKKEDKKDKKGLDKEEGSVYNIKDASFCKGRLAVEYTEKYSRGRRGAPAKGVGRLYRRESSNLSFSAKKKSRASGFFFLYSSLFTFHSSLFSKSPTRLFQRRDKREERKEKEAFRYGEKQFIKQQRRVSSSPN